MLFNSFAFALFLPIVLILYWLLPFRWQNRMLLIASYVFYGYWDWRFLFLIALSTVVDYVAGLQVYKHEGHTNDKSVKLRKIWLVGSICSNLVILGFFKYFNFFIDTFAGLLGTLNVETNSLYLEIILPVGISFYTFQTMSYTIDIYRKKMLPTRRFIDFALYVAFFPQLVAGPIERACNLLPLILNKRTFNRTQFFEGVHLIFWGLFKKVYVADNLAPIVNRIFGMSDPTGMEAVIGTYAFAFQIYCDFSGYSDIARGVAKCMGFELMLNFNHPYVAISASDFWRRWHISLSTWLRDYLYVPLGGNRKGNFRTYVNLFLTMLLGGMWHGASWIFILWGAYQGAFLLSHRLMKPLLNGISIIRMIPYSLRHLIKMVFVFQLVCIGWIIFRAQSVDQVVDMLTAIFTWRGSADYSLILPLLQFAGPLMLFDLIQAAFGNDELQKIEVIPIWIKSCVYAIIFYLLAFYGASAQSFIYFQF